MPYFLAVSVTFLAFEFSLCCFRLLPIHVRFSNGFRTFKTFKITPEKTGQERKIEVGRIDVFSGNYNNFKSTGCEFLSTTWSIV